MKVNMVHSAKGGGQLNIRFMGLTLIQFLMLYVVYLMSFYYIIYTFPELPLRDITHHIVVSRRDASSRIVSGRFVVSQWMHRGIVSQ